MSYENEYYAASGSGQQQQPSTSQQGQQQPPQSSDTPLESYPSQFFADPRYQVPPNFLDDPPRGPDNVPRMPAGSPQYFMNSQAQPQDPSSWANYLRLPTGLTPPVPGHRSNENDLGSYPPSNNDPAYALSSSSNLAESASASYLTGLSSFPSMSLDGHPSESHPYDSGSSLGNQPLPNSTLSPSTESALIVRQGFNSSLAVARRNDTPPTVPGPLLYSSSGFDMIGVLARVANRRDPQVVLGPVDFTCSFVVSDATKPDEPIVYASPTFVSFPFFLELGRNTLGASERSLSNLISNI